MSLKNKIKKHIKQKGEHERKYDSEKERRIKENRQEIIRKVKEDLNRKFRDRLRIKEADLRKEAMIREKEYNNKKKSADEKKIVQIRKDMKTIIEAGVEKVHAVTILPEKIKFDESTIMTIGEVKYKLKNNVHMVGWGREALMLGAAFERIIGNQLKKGWLVVPRKSIFGLWNYPMCFPKLDTRIAYYEAGTDGFADDKSVEATRKIAEYCKDLKKTDILVVIISGGTKELLCYPKGTIGVKDKLNLLEKLKAAGATSKEINDVRKKLSVVRGGGLARLAYPAKVITLIMSDMPGDPIDEIAGGPTVNDSKQETTALSILDKYNLTNDVPNSMREILEEKPPIVADSLVDENNKFKFVDCYVIASIVDAIEAMAIAAFKLGLVPIKLSPSIIATVREVSQEYAKLASLLVLAVEGKITKLEMYEAMKNSNVLPLTGEKIHEIFPTKETWGLGLCLLMGGRPLVEINGNGNGGPNQELALHFSLEWHAIVKKFPILKQYVVWFLGGSTSGADGNTNVAGAYGYGSLGQDIYKHLKELTDKLEETCKKARNLAQLKPDSKETKEAFELADDLKSERAKLLAMLPDYVMKQNNTNFMFMNINDGDELLELGTGIGYTYTDVRDLHVIRIVRFQCNCDGSCLEQNERLRQSSIYKDGADYSQSKLQCCSRLARPKLKIY